MSARTTCRSGPVCGPCFSQSAIDARQASAVFASTGDATRPGFGVQDAYAGVCPPPFTAITVTTAAAAAAGISQRARSRRRRPPDADR